MSQSSCVDKPIRTRVTVQRVAASSANFTATRTTVTGRSVTPARPAGPVKNSTMPHASQTSVRDASPKHSGPKLLVAKQTASNGIQNSQLMKNPAGGGVGVKKPVAKQRSGGGTSSGDAAKSSSGPPKAAISKQGSGGGPRSGEPVPAKRVSAGASKTGVSKQGSGDGAKRSSPVSATPRSTSSPPKTTVTKQTTGNGTRNGNPVPAKRATGPTNTAISKQGSGGSGTKNGTSVAAVVAKPPIAKRGSGEKTQSSISTKRGPSPSSSMTKIAAGKRPSVDGIITGDSSRRGSTSSTRKGPSPSSSMTKIAAAKRPSGDGTLTGDSSRRGSTSSTRKGPSPSSSMVKIAAAKSSARDGALTGDSSRRGSASSTKKGPSPSSSMIKLAVAKKSSGDGSLSGNSSIRSSACSSSPRNSVSRPGSDNVSSGTHTKPTPGDKTQSNLLIKQGPSPSSSMVKLAVAKKSSGNGSIRGDSSTRSSASSSSRPGSDDVSSGTHMKPTVDDKTQSNLSIKQGHSPSSSMVKLATAPGEGLLTGDSTRTESTGSSSPRSCVSRQGSGDTPSSNAQRKPTPIPRNVSGASEQKPPKPAQTAATTDSNGMSASQATMTMAKPEVPARQTLPVKNTPNTTTVPRQVNGNGSQKQLPSSSSAAERNGESTPDFPPAIIRKAASEKRERDVAVKYPAKKSSSVNTMPIHRAEATMRILLAQSANASSARWASRTNNQTARSPTISRTPSNEKIEFGSPPRIPPRTGVPFSMATNGRKISTSSIPSPPPISEEEQAPPRTPSSPTPPTSPVIDFFGEKQELIEPVEYEEHILKNRNVINNDPLRSLIIFPYDDVSASTIPRQLRTTKSTVPEGAIQEASSLFVKECLSGYLTEWKVINNKYSSYGGQFKDVPGYHKEFQPQVLKEQVYEVDDVEENQETTMNSPSGNIVMQGFLYKTPFGQQSGLIRAYKRRYFYLRQLADKSFVLVYHKDEKSNVAKGTVYLDSLLDIVKMGKQRKFGMELQMQDNLVHSIAGENQQQMDEWYSALKKVIEQQKQDANPDKQSMSSMEDLLDQDQYADDPMPSANKSESSMEKSKHPELQGYGNETEKSNSQKRKENRNNLFMIYPRMQVGEKVMTEPDCKPYEEEFGKRFVVDFQRLVFRLSAILGKDGEPCEIATEGTDNIEPFFTSMALFDAKDNCKISEDFHIDLNNQTIRNFMDKCRDMPNGSSAAVPGSERRRPSTLPDIMGLNENWLKYPQKAIFSVKKAHSEIYLVVRVEKVLQGGITQCAEPYIKTGDVVKTCQKVMKQAKIFCSRMGQYRMPFAWTARRVFSNDYGELDLRGEFTPIYRQESSKLSNEDLLKQLQDIKRNPEKLSKLTEIPGSLKVTVEPLTRMLSNCLTSSLVPTMPWPETPIAPPTLEVEEFLPEKGNLSHPFTTYTNNLYVYPIQLKYDSQKTFTKARNIALCVEFRDSDDEGAQPLKAIYGRPGGPIFVSSGSAAVLHHHQVPDFYEEIKVALPTQLREKHHLLFRFYHVSCEVGKGTVKKRDTVDSFAEPLEVGYAWIPILDAGKPNFGDMAVTVSSNLPPGYLGTKGMGKPELKLVDSGKQLLKVHIRLTSTIYTTAQHLHNFFSSCELWEGKNTGALEVIQCIKAMHAVEPDVLIKFLPVILNQLFRILPTAVMDEVQLNVVRLIIFIVSQVHQVGREDVLYSYVKYVFETEKESDLQKTVHEELVKNLAMSLRPSTDQQVIKHLMKHMWFFFTIIIKSMAQHLIKSDRLKLARHQRFSTNFETGLRNLVQVLMPHILQKQDVRQRQDAKDANFHLANFIKRCFTYMDRGFVFRLINCYMSFFNSDDAKPVFEMKFELIRVVCSYEHYIALNLPLQKKGQQSGKNFKTYMGNMRKYVPIRSAKEQYKDLHYDYQLTEEYCQNHFLTGLLLREVGSALHDVTEVRQNGIRVLRNLFAKHSFDDRYMSKQYQARIAALYLPLISIILNNAPRLSREAPPTPGSASINGDSLFDMSSMSTSSLITDSPGVDRHNSVSTAASKAKSLQRDSAVLDIIAGRGVRHSTSIPALTNQHVRRMSAGGLSDISSTSTKSISEIGRSDRTSGKSERGSTRSDRSSTRANRLSWLGMSETLRSLHLTLPPGLSSSQNLLTPPTSSPGDVSPRRLRKQAHPLSMSAGKGEHASPTPSQEEKSDSSERNSSPPTSCVSQPPTPTNSGRDSPILDALKAPSSQRFRKISLSKPPPSPTISTGRVTFTSTMSSPTLMVTPSRGTPTISDPLPFGRTGSSTSLSSSGSGVPISSSLNGGTGPSSAHTSMLSDSSEKSESQSTITGSTTTGKGHNRTKSTIMYDKLLDHEIKDLLICLMYILKNVNEEVLLGWWSKAGEEDQIKLFDVLEMCLYHFQYKGKKHIIAARLREKPTSHAEEKSKTLPASRARAMQTRSLHGDLPVLSALAEAEGGPRILQEANLSAEVGLVVLDVLGTYCTHFKPNLDIDDGDNPLMRKIMDMFLSFVKIGQSESMSKHVFASLRSFVHKFPLSLFKGSAQLCGDICLSTLKCLNSKLPSIRNEACALLYLIMKENYEYTQRKDFVRVHLQVVISVSKLIGEANSVRFQESLAMINNYANSDKTMAHTQFPSHVKDLTKKIRTVLMATAQMKEHEKDAEMLVDLQYSLAKSYASTPELRRTWLESMAIIHINHGNYSEAAHCNIHIAALIAEYLKRKGTYPSGCLAFKEISPNIESEERGMKDDTGLEDVQYSEQTLLSQLERCAEDLQKAERYESMGALYKLIIPFYEKQRDFHRLAMAYGKLCEAYKSVMKVTSTGRRLLGQYFRVAFFGQHFEEDDGKEFIYKEPKITTLASICERLITLFSDKFGKENIKLIRDSTKVNADDLDPKIAYIQLTFVKPFFDDQELQERQTSYERNNNIRRFVYETPFTEGGKARGSVEEQCKLKTILTTSHAFPYVKKRILVVYQRHQKLNPIQVAIDEVKAKVQELNDVLITESVDMKRLQLLLQGCVSTQVNAGPQAYAVAFLGKGKEEKWKNQDVWELKQLFREFVEVCGKALEINERLIKEDQYEYHEDMAQKYKAMAMMLSELLQEQSKDQDTSPGRRVSGHFFNAISGM